ncbi:MAG: cryptochrome/photolyase family protein [Bacteroidia bacterium]
MDKICLFWFRRDLRLHDNHGLYEALRSGYKVLPFFLFDREILDELEDTADKRVNFIHQTLSTLQHQLNELNSSVFVAYGKPVEAFQSLVAQFPVHAVYTNRDYEPRAIKRDAAIHSLLKEQGIAFHSYKDQVIFEKDEVLKPNGTPYVVFTPYSNGWKKRLGEHPIRSYPSENHLASLQTHWKFELPKLESFGFKQASFTIPPNSVSENRIREYDKTRDFPFLAGTSRYGVHFRFGTISIREKVKEALHLNETFLNELIWRDFYQMILATFPFVATRSFKPAYDGIAWRNDPGEFRAWCQGKTGYPLVDAGMRELDETGFMHNRVRMVTAGFLCKHLLIDWQWGEAWFAQKLLDFDLASNNGGWQWAAGSGVDAAPYFRVFNPEMQQKKFDPSGLYIKRWIKEWGTPLYPSPIVKHEQARKRCIEVYRSKTKAKG